MAPFVMDKDLACPCLSNNPTLNAESALPTLLSSLFEGLDAAIIREVIVADGGSRDATVDMAEKVGCHVEHCAKGAGGKSGREYLLLKAIGCSSFMQIVCWVLGGVRGLNVISKTRDSMVFYLKIQQ